MLKKYLALNKMIEEMVAGGMHDLDPVIRSMTRQLAKRYLALAEADQKLIYAEDL